jgi:hypothetical protein
LIADNVSSVVKDSVAAALQDKMQLQVGPTTMVSLSSVFYAPACDAPPSAPHAGIFLEVDGQLHNFRHAGGDV